jgi:hypothetical protein
MLRGEVFAVFQALRARMARVFPAVRGVRLNIVRRHFLPRPSARDLAWFDSRTRVVSLLSAALHGHPGRVGGLLAHELGHAADPDPWAPYAERRADALAFDGLGQPILYDNGDVQNLDEGAAPRPARLPENRHRRGKQ